MGMTQIANANGPNAPCELDDPHGARKKWINGPERHSNPQGVVRPVSRPVCYSVVRSGHRWCHPRMIFDPF